MKARTTIVPVIPPDYKNMHNRLCDPAEHNLTHFKLLQCFIHKTQIQEENCRSTFTKWRSNELQIPKI